VARGYPLLLGDGCRLRRASADDVDFLAALASAAEVEPFLAARSARTREELLEQVLLAEETPQEAGRFVLEVPEGDGWQRAGALAFEVSNRRSRIVWLHAVMVEPAFRGRGLAEHAVRALVRHLIADLGYHRVQLEVYGFNERAMRHAERSGFVLEGRKRRAYLRDGAWIDGVLYGLTVEDLEASPEDR
jgi:RimJ/RimL family protein N-acetyltransferase